MKNPVCRQDVLAKPTAALGALAAAISALYAPAIFAAEAGATKLDEVVVSARRREEMAQDVPISMTVMTEEFLKTNNINKVEDLGTKVPSMRISAAGASVNEPIISLRGQRQGEAAYNQDPAAPIYFNEIVIAPTQGSNMGLYDLEGLQVLKGPQGTLFGRNSTGGAMLVTPKRPGNTLGGYVEVKAGDFNLWGFEGAVDVPLNDMVTTRLSAHKLDRDGYQENIANNALHGRDYRDEHSEGARLSVNFAHDAFNTLSVFAYDENHMSAAVPVIGVLNPQAGLGSSAAFRAAVAEQVARDNPWKVKSDIDAEEAVKNVFFSNTSEYEINDGMTVKNVFGYRSVKFANANDSDGTALPLLGTPTLGAVTFDPRLNTVDTEFFSDELQLFGTALDDRLDWLGGLYWSKLQGTEDKLTMNGGPTQIDSVLSDIINTSYGIMAEGTYAFTDEWSLTAGARNSWDERELTIGKWNTVERNGAFVNPITGSGCGMFAEGVTPVLSNPANSRSPLVGARAPECKRDVDEKFDKPTFKFSLNYTPEANTLVYGSIATGYRAGGFNTRGTTDETLQPYDQENVVTYELGHKKDWEFSDVSVRTSVAAYFQNYEDIQNTISFEEGGRLVTRTENAGKAEISGVEFEVNVKPTDNLRVDASYSYIDAQYIKKESTIDPIGAPPPMNVDTSGNDFSYIPKQSLTASTTYTLPLDASIGEVSLTAGVYWQDEMSSHPLRNDFDRYGWSASTVDMLTKFSTVDAYSVYNLRANWHGVMGSTFDVAAYMDNVTDEEYVLGGLNVVESLGIGAYHYGAPRTVGASVKYSF